MSRRIAAETDRSKCVYTPNYSTVAQTAPRNPFPKAGRKTCEWMNRLPKPHCSFLGSDSDYLVKRAPRCSVISEMTAPRFPADHVLLRMKNSSSDQSLPGLRRVSSTPAICSPFRSRLPRFSGDVVLPDMKSLGHGDKKRPHMGLKGIGKRRSRNLSRELGDAGKGRPTPTGIWKLPLSSSIVTFQSPFSEPANEPTWEELESLNPSIHG